jgi:hypothetical protein
LKEVSTDLNFKARPFDKTKFQEAKKAVATEKKATETVPFNLQSDIRADKKENRDENS